MRSCARILAAGVLVTASLLGGGGIPAAGRAAPASADPAPVPAASTMTIVSMPDLAITHRLPGGGMNLWRLPVTQLDPHYGVPQLVKKLDYGGFSYDRSVTLAGDIGYVAPGDDGTADHVIWQAQPNGGVLLWGVSGGGDPTPQLWADLRTGGWSYLASTPMVGDVTGDHSDDLVVLHRIAGTYTDNVWLFPSDGNRLGAPQLMGQIPHISPSRSLMADVNGDGLSDLVTVQIVYGDPQGGQDLYYEVWLADDWGPASAPYQLGPPSHGIFLGRSTAGWSYDASRQLAGDVTGDGLVDLVTVHAQPGGGMLVWVSQNCNNTSPFCFGAPQVWQNLQTGGWSFAGSRQYLADTNGDGLDDLISVHSQPGGGEIVWRALSTGTGFGTPQIVANLKTGGWNYLDSRESTASRLVYVTN